MARIAVISDVHGNLEALINVLDDIYMQRVDKVICLGDTIGYGADPEECLDLVREHCDVVLQGNHENAVLNRILSDDFLKQAADSVVLTKERLMPMALNPEKEYIFKGEADESEKEERWEFLRKLPEYHEEEGALFVHGSPRNPIMEYFGSGDIAIFNLNSKSLPEEAKKYYSKRPSMYNAYKMDAVNKLKENFGIVNKIACCGHNHIPCINSDIGNDFEVVDVREYIEKSRLKIRFPDGREMLADEMNEARVMLGEDIRDAGWFAYMFPSEDNKTNVFKLGNQKVIVNVGAVGQPRNCDPRATYFIYDDIENTLECRRVSYDIEAAAKKIKEWGNEGFDAGLITHNFDKLAERLYKGV